MTSKMSKMCIKCTNAGFHQSFVIDSKEKFLFNNVNDDNNHKNGIITLFKSKNRFDQRTKHT